MMTLIQQYEDDLFYLKAKLTEFDADKDKLLEEKSALLIANNSIIHSFLPQNAAGQASLMSIPNEDKDLRDWFNVQLNQEHDLLAKNAAERIRQLDELSLKDLFYKDILKVLSANNIGSIDFVRLNEIYAHKHKLTGVQQWISKSTAGDDYKFLLKELAIDADPKSFFKRNSETVLSDLTVKCQELINAVHAEILILRQHDADISRPLALKKQQKETLFTNKARIAVIDQKVSEIDQQCETFSKLIEQYNDAIKLETQKEVEEIARLALDARQALIGPLLHSLNEYELYRNAQFQFKDLLSSKDKVLRHEFIVTLNATLNNFKREGTEANRQAILAHIEKNQHLFAGVKLSALLNAIKFKILSFNSPMIIFPKDYDGISAIPVVYDAKLREAIIGLYDQLDDMTTYGEKFADTAVSSMAEDLKLDLHQFIIEHPKQQPSPEDFNAFKNRFTAHLHSQDDVMSERLVSQWWPMVANIILALTTLGVALAIQLAYSKITTGRAFVFFSETERQRQVADIDKALGQIIVPSLEPHVPDHDPNIGFFDTGS